MESCPFAFLVAPRQKDSFRKDCPFAIALKFLVLALVLVSLFEDDKGDWEEKLETKRFSLSHHIHDKQSKRTASLYDIARYFMY